MIINALACIITCNPHSSLRGRSSYPHFTDEAETQRDKIAHPRSWQIWDLNAYNLISEPML